MNMSYSWLKFLSETLAPGFVQPPMMCNSSSYLHKSYSFSALDHRRRPNLMNQMENEDFLVYTSLALSAASSNPELATSDLGHHQLQSSASFPLPLPIFAPPSLALSLCPGCLTASPTGVARIWADFRFPNLLIGLMRHATLTTISSFGLNGQVKVIWYKKIRFIHFN